MSIWDRPPGQPPRLLDLYCGAGGAARGYVDAGWEVIGVDRQAQQNWPWPDNFIKMDAMRALDLLDLRNFDAIHASPPCQTHSTLRYRREDRAGGEETISLVRARLARANLPYVIENVVGAPLLEPLMLCGSMFPETIGVRRHRLFECSFPVEQPECHHELQTPRYHNPDKRGGELTSVVNVHGSPSYPGEAQLRKQVMGIHWMTNRELTQAIPPAYTEWLGMKLAAYLALPVQTWSPVAT